MPQARPSFLQRKAIKLQHTPAGPPHGEGVMAGKSWGHQHPASQKTLYLEGVGGEPSNPETAGALRRSPALLFVSYFLSARQTHLPPLPLFSRPEGGPAPMMGKVGVQPAYCSLLDWICPLAPVPPLKRLPSHFPEPRSPPAGVER